jgi:hypothetical protein
MHLNVPRCRLPFPDPLVLIHLLPPRVFVLYPRLERSIAMNGLECRISRQVVCWEE